MDTTRFVAASGKQFVYYQKDNPSEPFKDGPLPTNHGDLLYSPDGQTFFETVSNGFIGSEYYHSLHFVETTTGTKGTVRRVSAVLHFGDEVFVESKEPFKPLDVTLVALPKNRVPVWLGQAEDGTFFYISTQVLTLGREHFELYVGAGIIMRHVEITEIDDRLEEGVWFLASEGGAEFLDIPLGLPGSDAVPKWCDRYELTELPVGDYAITETDDGQVTIRKIEMPNFG